ncbi:glycoside hydrolase family 76 protein [Anditalea andensis]|nr:glycoside hydrolase family 76 protein [Anditalea andensis]
MTNILYGTIFAILLGNVLTFKNLDKEFGPDFPSEFTTLAEQNLLRAMDIMDNAVEAHFKGEGMAMSRYYNPITELSSSELGSVWMYTAAIEAVNSILHSLETFKAHGNASLYNNYFEKYTALLERLTDNADFYLGTFELTSYTQTKEWTIYGVHRANTKGFAKVNGIENVYDDQMWLIIVFIEAYKATGNNDYLAKAEYLTEYVLDGWDNTIDSNGVERGGIPWGPGYVTKHACSNGPMISPLVWLYKLYRNQADEITNKFIDPEDRQTRRSEPLKKSEYYLDFAKKIYVWQKKSLMRNDGVYDDMMGGCMPGSPEIETIDNINYRKGISCHDRIGPAISYNSGTMLSGAAELYKVTKDRVYIEDARKLSDASFQYFSILDKTIPGHYTFDISGFRNWFNGVLMRGYVDIYPEYTSVDNYLDSFQKNLDYGYEKFYCNGFLPTDLLNGWSNNIEDNNTEGMFSFAYATQYAVLASHELKK